jgi:trimeric autotransporter adhesin
VIGGGNANTASGAGSFVGGGGYDGSIVSGNQATGNASVISGGLGNDVIGNYATVSGGQQNIIAAGSDHAVIGGGSSGIISSNDSEATIGGGDANAILDISNNADYATIGGGENNTNSSNAGTIAGGQNNFAAGQYQSTVGGGYNNLASGDYGTVPGGYQNVAGGVSSFAAGAHAQATNNGAFVWSDDSVSTAFSSTNNNSFNIRASGGVRIATTTSGTVGAILLANQTSWTTLSDRNAKKNFRPVDYQALLDKLASVPIEQWNYKWESDQDVPNIGPMAQDFKHAFYPGRDDKGISTLEFDGVELAAIQGLNQKLNEKDAEIQALQVKVSQVDLLEARLNELEQTVQSLANKK